MKRGRINKFLKCQNQSCTYTGEEGSFQALLWWFSCPQSQRQFSYKLKMDHTSASPVTKFSYILCMGIWECKDSLQKKKSNENHPFKPRRGFSSEKDIYHWWNSLNNFHNTPNSNNS